MLLATCDRIEQLAQVSAQTEAYVRQLLALAFLAPDITEAILLGKQPRHLTVNRLVRMKVPLYWQAQRRALNIACPCRKLIRGRIGDAGRRGAAAE